MFYLEIQVYIPPVVQEPEYNVDFIFTTPDLKTFGDRMHVRIKVQ